MKSAIFEVSAETCTMTTPLELNAEVAQDSSLSGASSPTPTTVELVLTNVLSNEKVETVFPYVTTTALSLPITS
jgi:hypothetical protein